MRELIAAKNGSSNAPNKFAANATNNSAKMPMTAGFCASALTLMPPSETATPPSAYAHAIPATYTSAVSTGRLPLRATKTCERMGIITKVQGVSESKTP